MNLLFSEETDFSTNMIIDWLAYYEVSYEKYIGIPKHDEQYTFSDKDITLALGFNKSENFSNTLSNVTSTWFRRPNLRIDPFLNKIDYKGVYPKEKLQQTINGQLTVFWDFLRYHLNEKHHFGSFKTVGLNKLIVLNEAEKLGLNIPKTLVTNSKKDLEVFFELCNKKIITKSLHEVIRDHRHEVKENEYVFIYQMTKLLENLDDDSPNIFAPSLFQEYIDKLYEIRTIFINGKCYSTCLFSQLNKQTKVDMRNRDVNHPTRYMPYKLPQKIETKITKLMKIFDLSYGAIDIIRSVNDSHYFLEINPVGQFGDVSIYGNYYLHKIIAEYLIKNNKND